MIETIPFSISILQLLIVHFYAFLRQFIAGETFRVARDSAGRWHILTSLPCCDGMENVYQQHVLLVPMTTYPGISVI